MAQEKTNNGQKQGARQRFLAWIAISVGLGVIGLFSGFPLCCLPFTLVMAAIEYLNYAEKNGS